jgi:hypothetical protein
MPPQARRRAAGKDNSPGMQIDYDGRTYVVRESDLTPRLVAELRRETGFAGWVGLGNEAKRGFDLDVLAALVWLARRVQGETVDYGTVLDGMGYDLDVKVGVEGQGDQESSDSPEA